MQSSYGISSYDSFYFIRFRMYCGRYSCHSPLQRSIVESLSISLNEYQNFPCQFIYLILGI
jgi:hypothetical protein